VTLDVIVLKNGDTERHFGGERRPPFMRESLRRMELGKYRVCLPEGNPICYTSAEWLRLMVVEKGGHADTGQ